MARSLPASSRWLVLLLLLLSLVAAGSAKKKKSSAEWAAAASAIEEEERAEAEQERAQEEAERERQQQLNQPQFDMSDPSKWIEAQGGVENAMAMQGGGMMGGGGGGGGGGGSAMTFVHLNNETITSAEQAEELVVQWRDLLMTAGIEVGVYVIEPHLLLLDTNDKSKVIQIKDFIVTEAPGGADHVEYFEVNQQKFYPEDKDPNPAPEWEKPGGSKKKKKKGQMRAFNTLAKEVMAVVAAGDGSEEQLARRVKQGSGMAERLRSEAEKESAAYYMKVIQKLIDGAEVIWLVPKTRRSSVLNRVDLLFDHPDY
jgi:hypothetical protein